MGLDFLKPAYIEQLMDNAVSELVTRKELLDFEQILKQIPGNLQGKELERVCKLEHKFAPGLYTRKVTIPADMYLVGNIHRHEHPVFLQQGEIVVITENGKTRMRAPMDFISPAGVKRAAKTVTETIWVTVHQNPDNIRDMDELEAYLFAKDYEDFENYNKKLISQ